MTHKEFITKIEGFTGIKIKPITKGVANGAGTALYAVVDHHEVGVIPKSKYKAFGYYCGGVYAQCNRTKQEEFDDTDVVIAMGIAIECMYEVIKGYDEKHLDFWDVKDYLRKYDSGIKRDKNAIKRTLDILDYNYQKIPIKKKERT